MAESPHRFFPHRYNADGTVDSICRQCFLIVAQDKNESALHKAEAEHVCAPTVPSPILIVPKR
jgi:hypothetical protein